MIIGASNASVDFESLGHRDSGTNHRNHFALGRTLHSGSATPHAAHVRRSPHRLLGSGFAWWAVGIVPAIRTHLASRLERALAATAFFLGGWAFLDAVYPAFAGVSPQPDAVFIGLRVTLISFATLALLLTTKWMARGT